MKRAIGFLVAILGLLTASLGGPASADRDIVYSAQFYRWSGKYYSEPGEKTAKPTPMLADVGPYRLYRINPDGSRRKRITSGTANDIYPAWSPDGNAIAFVRTRDFEHQVFCLVKARGGRVTTLARVSTDGDKTEMRWAPNGRTIGFRFAPADSRTSLLYLIDTCSKRVRKLRNVVDFAWSPDGSRLFLRSGDGAGRIETVGGHRSVAVTAPVANPFWIAPNRLAGEDVSDQERSAVDLKGLKIVDRNGRVVRRIQFRLPKMTEAMEMFDSLYDSRTWQAVSKNRYVLCESVYRQSDGSHAGCFRLNLLDGRLTFIGYGQVIGVSPRRTRVILADDEWLGNYKEFRGGRRVGPLQAVDLRTGLSRKITGRLMNTAGGDWRKPVRNGANHKRMSALPAA